MSLLYLDMQIIDPAFKGKKLTIGFISLWWTFVSNYEGRQLREVRVYPRQHV